jgi:hypothetical protein
MKRFPTPGLGCSWYTRRFGTWLNRVYRWLAFIALRALYTFYSKISDKYWSISKARMLTTNYRIIKAVTTMTTSDLNRTKSQLDAKSSICLKELQFFGLLRDVLYFLKSLPCYSFKTNWTIHNRFLLPLVPHAMLYTVNPCQWNLIFENPVPTYYWYIIHVNFAVLNF